MSSELLPVGLIEHTDEDCPAKHKDKADEIIPPYREALENGQVPGSLDFSTKDHGGTFVESGTVDDVKTRLPQIPRHQVRLKDATGDEVAARRLEADDTIAEEERRTFIAYAEERYFPGRFPRKDQKIVGARELPDYVESQHKE